MESKYMIILSDGTEINDLRLNGNNYISKKEITESMFKGKCAVVSISDGVSSLKMNNVEVIHVTKMEDEWWFALRELSQEELTQKQIRSDIAYIAMMSGIEL